MSEELIARAKDFVAGTEKLSKGRDEEDMVPADVGGMRSLASLIDSLATALQEAREQREQLGREIADVFAMKRAAESKLAEAEGKLSRVRAWVDSQSFTADRGEAKAVVKRLLEGEGS